ncbi:MAG: NapC/NirT family cytochrome c [Cocleimonas sp.]|nr:NapC/NirT family cytochrome c [Cocleimonas sp.]
MKLLMGVFIGILLWGGFNWSLEMTNTESYCLSCHEMQGISFDELQETVHYSNRTGVRASCPDCHVPKEWTHKVVQKISAAIRELPAHWSGKLDTPEKFEEHRLAMATLEWNRMKANGSRECKNCHDSKSMDYTKQEPRSSARHEEAEAEGKTCIDCHKGIAHHLPKGWKEASKEATDKK